MLGGLGEAPIVESVWITAEYKGAATEQEMNSVVNEALETCPGAYCVKNPIPLAAQARKL